MKYFIAFVCVLGAALALPTRAGVVPNTPENIYRLEHLKEGEDAWEFSGQFEGDIVLSDKQFAALEERNGAGYEHEKWPNSTIPYVLSGPFTQSEEKLIRECLKLLELSSCIRFVPRTVEPAYVDVISTNSGCYSSIGHRGGRQTLNLGYGCMGRGVILHEFIHTIGFLHMQGALTRDDYVDILYENIKPGYEGNFNKYKLTKDYGVEYDYNSIMHYGRGAFSIHGLPTILPKDPNAEIGQRVGLSRRDIEKINRMYDCPL